MEVNFSPSPSEVRIFSDRSLALDAPTRPILLCFYHREDDFVGHIYNNTTLGSHLVLRIRWRLPDADNFSSMAQRDTPRPTGVKNIDVTMRTGAS